MLPTTSNRFQPFAMLREMDRALNAAAHTAGACCGTPAGSITVDAYEADDVLTFEAELPGYAKDQVHINVEQGVLTLEADRSAPQVDDGEDGTGDDTKPDRVEGSTTRHLGERSRKVSRRFRLPTSYDTNRIDAVLENGVLTLTLPKREEVKPRAIEVK